MSKLNVIRVEWLNDEEVHIHPPDGGDAWWARPVKKYVGEGVLWELHSGLSDEPEGYFEVPEAAVEYVSTEFDDAPVIVTKDNR